jgi:squalene-hopene/tetraprenyl-beta-curcumene cyclase
MLRFLTSLFCILLFSLGTVSCDVGEGESTDSPDGWSRPDSEVEDTLDRAVEFLRQKQAPDGFWMGTFFTDVTFTADYILLMHYVDRLDSERQAKAVNHILSEQLPDGGWAAYPGGPSMLDLSVITYAALKVASVDPNDPAMKKAREFILGNGGAESSNQLIRTKLAHFGHVPWNHLLPLNTTLIRYPEIVHKIGYFHSVLIPLLVLYENKYVPELNPHQEISEIFIENPWEGVTEKEPRQGCCEAEAIDWMLLRQEADGNWAGVFINTMFSMMALHSTGNIAYANPIAKGMYGVEQFQIESDSEIHQQFSQSPVMDTAYVLHLFLSAGIEESDEAVENAIDYLLSKQTFVEGDWRYNNPTGPPGGWGFEHHNHWYPDVDCAAMVLDAFAMLSREKQNDHWESIQAGLGWVVSMQNDDGGWAAWDKNAIDPEVLLPSLTGEIWLPKDLSWEDVTARVLLALADLGYPGNFGDPTVIKRGVQFLKKRQMSPGYWYGRWGVNFTYATGQVLQALMAVGKDPEAEYIQRAIRWLISVQNADGGWGETQESYLHESYAGRGESTIFQTSYVLIGLIAAGQAQSSNVERGIQFLIDQIGDDGSWWDHEFLGCNLPGYWYSRYELLSTYKAAYALSLYQKATEL